MTGKISYTAGCDGKPDCRKSVCQGSEGRNSEYVQIYFARDIGRSIGELTLKERSGH